ncbi:hypothetical protein HOLleu_14480 [Holothuria leucospilota]|uniref:Uncharacterized protein n=1 Tax=Holothuria leucospilota TaxID=206669 RepID=A0A9Q1HCI2_HOLLE|nr:hypothetical protein HOLleu_14480 [Holothuria leucospilota]
MHSYDLIDIWRELSSHQGFSWSLNITPCIHRRLDYFLRSIFLLKFTSNCFISPESNPITLWLICP